jgi:hypothetical protein
MQEQKKAPGPVHDIAKKFRDDLNACLEKEKKSAAEKNASCCASLPANKESLPALLLKNGTNLPPQNCTDLPNAMSFQSKMLASPDVMANPSFFKMDLALETLFIQLNMLQKK